MARLRHSCSITKTRTQSEGWSAGSPQVKGSAPGGASPSSSHTAPFPGYSCTASELARSTTSQTLGGEMRFCRVCWCTRGLDPLASGTNRPSPQNWGGEPAFPLLHFPCMPLSYLQGCPCPTSLLHGAGFYRCS